MFGLLKNIVKLSEEQYKQLKKNGQLEVNGKKIFFDENTLYVTNYQDIPTTPITSIKIVNSLPPLGKSNICYWLNDLDNNEYNQYVWINNRYEHLGSTKIKLDDYITKKEFLDKIKEIKEQSKINDKPIIQNYTLDSISKEGCDLELGDNYTTDARHLSITRNVRNIAHEALLTIYDDGSVRISHRNKNVDANNDDSYLDIGYNKFKYGNDDILTTKNAYKKDEIDAKLEEIRKLIKEQ